VSIVTPLNRVLGLGSAKSGAQHWWAQRLTAAGLVPLGLWLAWSMIVLGDFSYGSVIGWMGRPVQSVLLILTALTLTYHSHLGVQVVLEDYVHGKAVKVVSIVLSTFAHVVVAIAALFAILKVAFGAA
jgi:succinate dehydrogenase / fumarate reductase membrane anchor subunit